MMNFTKGMLLAIALQAGLPLAAQEIQTDRPDQTETPATVPAGYFQLEAGFSFERTAASVRTFEEPTALLKYGVNDRFELRLLTAFTAIDSGRKKLSGLSPETFGFKAKLAKEKGFLPAISFVGQLSVPYISGEQQRTTYVAPAFRFLFQHHLHKKVQLGYNLGAQWDGETPEPVFLYTLTVQYAFTKKWRAYAEVYGFAPEQHQADHRVDGGFTYLVRPSLQLDISAGHGITPDAPLYYISFGISFRIKAGKK